MLPPHQMSKKHEKHEKREKPFVFKGKNMKKWFGQDEKHEKRILGQLAQTCQKWIVSSPGNFLIEDCSVQNSPATKYQEINSGRRGGNWHAKRLKREPGDAEVAKRELWAQIEPAQRGDRRWRRGGGAVPSRSVVELCRVPWGWKFDVGDPGIAGLAF